jgi:hypothetical protein
VKLSPRPTPTRLRQALGRPALHLLLGGLFLAAFTWPFLTAERPEAAVLHLLITFSLAIAALFAVSRGEEPREPDGDDEAA